jgi:hypothetical protein
MTATLLHNRLQHRNLVLIRIFEMTVLILTCVGLHEWHPSKMSRWYSVSLKPTDTLNKFITQRATDHPIRIIYVQSTLYSVFWLLSAASVLVIVGMLIRVFSMGLFVSESDYWYPRSAYYSSVLIMGLIGLAKEFDRALANEGVKIDSILRERRDWLNRELRRLALIASGPWARYMRSQYGSAGDEIAGYGDAIDFTFRKWQVRAMFIGSDIFDLHKDITNSLVNAIDGKWELLAAEGTSGARQLKSRIYRALKRGVAILVPLGVAFLLWSHVFSVPSTYSQVLIIMLLGFSSYQLLAVIDPEAPGRLDSSAKLIDIFRRGHQSN